MANTTIFGQITQIGDTQTFGTEEKPFLKREFIVKTIEQYPEVYKLELIQDKTALIDPFSNGENVKVECSVRGREYQKEGGDYMVFMSLNAWQIEKN